MLLVALENISFEAGRLMWFVLRFLCFWGLMLAGVGVQEGSLACLVLLLFDVVELSRAVVLSEYRCLIFSAEVFTLLELLDVDTDCARILAYMHHREILQDICLLPE